MSLFGSVGIGPVRVGASTRGLFSPGDGVAFVVICVLLGVGAIVVWFAQLVAQYWYVFLPIVAFAPVLWGLVCLSEKHEERRIARIATIKRAHAQHAALMDGDDRLGVHGDFPPADL